MGDEEARLREHAEALADAVEAALPGWVVRCVAERAGAERSDVVRAARDAGDRARAEIGPRVRELLRADVDEQTTTPLAVLRAAATYPTAVLNDAGVPPVERDDFSAERFPDDVYDLTPATWSDIDETLAEPGIAWGAAKAFVHRRRHG